jgi:hypothetical protein
MPNTGQFYLLRVDGQADEAERLLEVTAVECNCLPCGAPRLLTTQGSTMSIHQVNICGFAQMLRALRGQLDKADAHALTTGYSSRDLLSARLAPDMYPLAKQIQFACIQAREAVCRLTGQPLPVLCTPGDMDQARELIDETLDHLAAADAAQIDAPLPDHYSTERPGKQLPGAFLFSPPARDRLCAVGIVLALRPTRARIVDRLIGLPRPLLRGFILLAVLLALFDAFLLAVFAGLGVCHGSTHSCGRRRGAFMGRLTSRS